MASVPSLKPKSQLVQFKRQSRVRRPCWAMSSLCTKKKCVRAERGASSNVWAIDSIKNRVDAFSSRPTQPRALAALITRLRPSVAPITFSLPHQRPARKRLSLRRQQRILTYCSICTQFPFQQLRLNSWRPFVFGYHKWLHKEISLDAYNSV